MLFSTYVKSKSQFHLKQEILSKAPQNLLGRRAQISHPIIWARKTAPFSLVVIILSILMFRYNLILNYELLTILCIGALIALIAIVLCIAGFVHIWQSGVRGIWPGLIAFLIAGVTLTPFIFAVFAILYYPKVNAVSSSNDTPIMLSDFSYNNNGRSKPESIVLQRQAYPEIVTQEFNVPVETLYTLAVDTAKRQKFEIFYELSPLLINMNNGNEFETQQVPLPLIKPILLADGSIVVRNVTENATSVNSEVFFEASVRTPLLALTDDIIVRIRSWEEGSSLDIRSASRIGLHDMGANARRVKAYLQELDLAVKATSLQ